MFESRSIKQLTYDRMLCREAFQFISQENVRCFIRKNKRMKLSSLMREAQLAIEIFIRSWINTLLSSFNFNPKIELDERMLPKQSLNVGLEEWSNWERERQEYLECSLADSCIPNGKDFLFEELSKGIAPFDTILLPEAILLTKTDKGWIATKVN